MTRPHTDTAAADSFDEWAILEILGHRRLAGRVSEVQVAGAGFLRIDIPVDPPMSQLYSPGSVYAISPVAEEVARRVAARYAPTPIHRWELDPPAHAEVEDMAADLHADLEQDRIEQDQGPF